MRVLIASAGHPFEQRQSLLFASRLAAAFEAAGHQSDWLLLPFEPESADLLDQCLAIRLMDLSHRPDRLIAVGFPAVVLSHPDKVGVFPSEADLSCAHPATGLAQPPAARALQSALRLALSECRAVYCLSPQCAEILHGDGALAGPPLAPAAQSLDGAPEPDILKVLLS